MVFPSYHQPSSIIKISLLAVVIRLIWALLMPVIPVSDSLAYDTFAQNIWQHGTYGWLADQPTSYWPVGTAAIYSVFYMLFGHVYWPIVVFNILCTVSIIIFAYLLCQRFLASQKVGLVLAIVLACWPTLIFYTTVLASELPYMAFLLPAFYVLTSEDKTVYKIGSIAGLLFAVAYYIRPLASIPLAIALFTLWMSIGLGKVLIVRSVITVLLMALLIAPWAYRNYQLYNAFVPMSTNSGATFWMGNQPGTQGGYLDLPAKVSDMDEYTRNNALKADAIAYIKEEPIAFVLRTIKKFFIFHLHETVGVTWNVEGITQVLGEAFILPLKLLTQAYWSLVLLFGVCGVILLLLRQGLWFLAFHPFTLLWLSTAGVHSIIVAQDRYHIPIIPFVGGFAAYYFIFLQDKFLKKENSDG